MYKALIIDDEAPARLAIKALGTWGALGIETVMEASNAGEGMNAIETLQPEIVFVDMKMPKMSGLEFIELAKRKLPQTKFIVISGFDDFSFTRGAIQLGALDYLLKPIKKSELNDILHKAIVQIDKERIQENKEISSGILRNITLPLVKEKLFTSIIDRNGPLHQFKDFGNYLGNSHHTCFHIIVIVLLNKSEIEEARFSNDQHSFYFAVTNALNELFGLSGDAFSFKTNKEEQEIITVLSSSLPLHENHLNQRIEKALLLLQETFGIECMAAVEESTAGMEHLDDAYQLAKRKLFQANLFIQKQRLVVSHITTLPQRISILEKRELLKHAIETRSLKYAVNLIQEFFMIIKQSGYYSFDYMRQTADELLVVIDLVNESYTHPFKRLFIHKIMNVELYFTNIMAYMERVFSETIDLNKQPEKLDVEKIKIYIDLNYYEDISMAFFTEKYYASKEHLLRLFKQKYGYGIYEYTLKVRMDKAQEMLADLSLQIQQIAESIGYHDSNYFSKAFKKYFGISPLDYRTSLNKLDLV